MTQAYLKISMGNKDKFIPISLDEVDGVAYISEVVCRNCKDKIISGEFEYKINFIE